MVNNKLAANIADAPSQLSASPALDLADGPIAIVDDDSSVVRSVARLLRHSGFDTLTYTSPRVFLDEIDRRKPACVVADLSMPELTGLELQQALESASLDYPIVFVTGRGDIRSSVQAMRGGAVDFIPKPFEPAELLEAVRRAIRRSRATRLARLRRTSIEQRVSSLTQREREVFEHVVEGRLNKQIAAELEITEKTVKVHRARVMSKMGVRSIAQLARLAEQLGPSARAN